MFTVEGYRIRFERKYPNHKAKVRGCFDTLCEIYRDGQNYSAGVGLARLHPNDIPDKVVGKKIALAKALANVSELSNGYPFSKEKRTIIWKAFHQWVESWNAPPNCFGEPTQEDEKCNKCSHLASCIDKLMGK